MLSVGTSHAPSPADAHLPTVHNLAMLTFPNQGSIMASNRERPIDFWKRVRPSPLMATLALNMCTAADKAASGGRLVDAATKYKKAMLYFEPSLVQYANDTEMREWTENRLDVLRTQLERLSK